MKAGNIVVFKIASGEEIIGEVFIPLGESVKIKNPAVIMMQRAEQGVGIALMPYMPYCDESVTFNKSAMIAEGVPSQKMINEYNRIFGSGIEVVPATALSGLEIVS